MDERVNRTPHRDGKIEAPILLEKPVRKQIHVKLALVRERHKYGKLTLTLGRGVTGAIAATCPHPIAGERTELLDQAFHQLRSPYLFTCSVLWARRTGSSQ